MAGTEYPPLREGMRRTGAALGAAQVPFALAGGYAAWVRGAPEPAHDADFTILEADVERAKEAVVGAGLEVEQPVEDWLFKAYYKGALVDVLFRMCGRPVTPELLARSDPIQVLGVTMPVMQATEILTAKVAVLAEHHCNFGNLLPVARALREQVDWAHVRAQTAGNPFAEAFLFLLARLAILPEASGAPRRTDAAGAGG
ncbi:hypothetical protein [Georgenia sp. SYP-B2076]|uniref:hypothetical protein n=1 Tax=Georgenia sp. SYP-B2076 TaxID=2495881 RepID=UPI000F8CF269|nr:hypothetical protein [Georgenia sp. SYP-B2076]